MPVRRLLYCPALFKAHLIEGLNAEANVADHLQIFKEIGGEKWSNLRELNSCMGDIDEDKPSPILDKEMVGQRGNDKVPSFQQFCHFRSDRVLP